MGDVKVSGPTRGAVPCRGRALPGPPAAGAVILRERGERGGAAFSSSVGCSWEKKPARLETITFFKATAFSHNSRAAGSSSASDLTRVFQALLRSEAQQVTADLPHAVISLSACAFPGVCGTLHLPEKKAGSFLWFHTF